MLITAEHLARWADSPEARGALAALVRRLILHAGGRLTRLAMPSGSGTDLPGFDGIVEATPGNAWVPDGRSVWELSCEKKVAEKARADLAKRTKATKPGERATTTFLFVTPRRWPAKARFEEDCRKAGWRAGRALDADDLLTWLEAAPAVRLWFGEVLGLLGEGVESPDRFFARWSRACKPAITPSALFTDRFRLARALRRAIPADAEQNGKQVRQITLRADSEEEAAAFAAALLQRNPKLAARSLVVTDRSGWRFVAKNPDIRIVLCAKGELAQHHEPRADLVVQVPYAQGDVSPLEGEPSPSTRPEIRIPRPRAEAFAAALAKLGFDEERARALAECCGRSWSVFRRLHAGSAAFVGAPWLKDAEPWALAPLALLGAWQERHGDREVVAEIARRPYEEIERALRVLAVLPDAPVLDFAGVWGGVWKAKARAELLLLLGPRITRGEVDRFLAAAKLVLEERDPALDLPPEQRWAAAVHGKARAHSAELRRGLADGLAALAVEGPTALAAEPTIGRRIEALVAGLLDGADAQRWLSVADLLPSLAEAAPDAFLDAVEKSLHAPDRPIAALFHETRDGSTGKCWFAPLLWAFECLAWEPAHLLRVGEILCELCAIPRKDRFANSPGRSLFGLFRPWYPQTGATLEQRLQALDRLTDRHPTVIFGILLGMLPGRDHAFPHARPIWRDDGLGPVRVTFAEWRRACTWAADRALELAKGQPERLARVIGDLDAFRQAEREDAASRALLAFTRTDPPEEDRERLRAALRDRISLDELRWQRPFPLRPSALPLARLYRRLAPSDLVLRNRWLFEERLPTLPGFFRKKDVREHVIWRHREKAIRDLQRIEGLAGLFRLAETSRFPDLVGIASTRAGIEPVTLVAEAIRRDAFATGLEGPIPTMVLGALAAAPISARRPTLEMVLGHLRGLNRPSEDLARVLVPCVDVPDLRDLVEAQPEEVRREIRVLRPRAVEDVRAILAAGQPIRALEVLVFGIVPWDPAVAFEALEVVVRNGPEPGAYQALIGPILVRAVERLEKADTIDRRRLAELEVVLLPRLQSYGAAAAAGALCQAITTDPEWFVELVKMRFHGQDEPRPAPDAQAKERAELAWLAFEACTSLPGQREDGSIDSEALQKFVGRVRELASAAGRLEECERMLGQILAHAPSEPDGRWPCEPVAALLDRLDREDLWTGFSRGTRNKRGDASGARHEGGGQERRLAAHYRRFAEGWSQRHPRIAARLREIAKAHERWSRREDETARLRMEGVP